MIDRKIHKFSKAITVWFLLELFGYIAILILEAHSTHSVYGFFQYAVIVLDFLMALYLQRNHSMNLLILMTLFFTVCADTYLVLLDSYYVLGTALFCLVQTIYAIYLKGTWRSISLRIVLFGCLALASASSGILAVLASYSFANLLVNVILAWNTYLKERNRSGLLFAIGLLLFLGCDACVGIMNIASGTPALIAFYLVWIFYVPSQACIVLSCC